MGLQPWLYTSGEFNTPRFYHFQVQQFMQLCLHQSGIFPFLSTAVCAIIFFWSHSGLFSFSAYLLASHPALGMHINGNRKQRSENEAKKRWLHELLYSEIVKSGTGVGIIFITFTEGWNWWYCRQASETISCQASLHWGSARLHRRYDLHGHHPIQVSYCHYLHLHSLHITDSLLAYCRYDLLGYHQIYHNLHSLHT